MKRRLICLICIISILMINIMGCGNATEEQVKSIKIGVTLYDQYDTFVSQLINDFKTCVAKKEQETDIAINVSIYNAAGSQQAQNEQVQNMIDNGCNVICCNLVDRTDTSAIITAAEKNDIPVIFFNRELVEEDLERWDKLYYVGARAFESGIMEGELAVDAFKNDPELDKNDDGVIQYVVLEGEAGHQDAIVRTEYSINTIVGRGFKVEKLSSAIANWNRAQAQTKMTHMISQFNNSIELVVANNDDMALGAIDALKADNVKKEDWPAVVGIDGTDVGREAVKNGEMVGTVYNDSVGQAKAMFDLAFALSTDSELDNLDLIDGKYIRLPYRKVTSTPISK